MGPTKIVTCAVAFRMGGLDRAVLDSELKEHLESCLSILDNDDFIDCFHGSHELSNNELTSDDVMPLFSVSNHKLAGTCRVVFLNERALALIAKDECLAMKFLETIADSCPEGLNQGTRNTLKKVLSYLEEVEGNVIDKVHMLGAYHSSYKDDSNYQYLISVVMTISMCQKRETRSEHIQSALHNFFQLNEPGEVINADKSLQEVDVLRTPVARQHSILGKWFRHACVLDQIKNDKILLKAFFDAVLKYREGEDLEKIKEDSIFVDILAYLYDSQECKQLVEESNGLYERVEQASCLLDSIK